MKSFFKRKKIISNKYNLGVKEIKISDELYWRICVHEAAHIAIAKDFGYEYIIPIIDRFTGLVSPAYVKRPTILSITEIEKFIIIYYSGYIAEKIILGEPSTGFLGNKESDFDQANDLLYKYVILSSKSISVTGLEFDNINAKRIENSIRILKKTEQLVHEKKEEIIFFAKSL